MKVLISRLTTTVLTAIMFNEDSNEFHVIDFSADCHLISTAHGEELDTPEFILRRTKDVAHFAAVETSEDGLYIKTDSFNGTPESSVVLMQGEWYNQAAPIAPDCNPYDDMGASNHLTVLLAEVVREHYEAPANVGKLLTSLTPVFKAELKAIEDVVIGKGYFVKAA